MNIEVNFTRTRPIVYFKNLSRKVKWLNYFYVFCLLVFVHLFFLRCGPCRKSRNYPSRNG